MSAFSVRWTRRLKKRRRPFVPSRFAGDRQYGSVEHDHEIDVVSKAIGGKEPSVLFHESIHAQSTIESKNTAQRLCLDKKRGFGWLCLRQRLRSADVLEGLAESFSVQPGLHFDDGCYIVCRKYPGFLRGAVDRTVHCIVDDHVRLLRDLVPPVENEARSGAEPLRK